MNSYQSLEADKWEGISIVGFNSFLLNIPICKYLDSVTIENSDYNFLHLSDVICCINGIEYSIKDITSISVIASSTLKGSSVFSTTSWLNGDSRFFSTKKENNSSITISFSCYTFIDYIKIVNREDGLWGRFKKFTVVSKKGSEIKNAINFSDYEEAREIILALYHRELNTIEHTICDDVDVSDLYLSTSLSKIAKNVEVISAILNKKLLCGSIDEVLKYAKHYERLLAIGFALFQYHKNIEIVKLATWLLLLSKGSVISFRLFNKFRELFETEFEDFEKELKIISKYFFGYELIVGAHKFTRPIRSYEQGILYTTIERVTNTLNNVAEVDVAICYGTLLGMYRDGDFIEHDDDMDLLAIIDKDRYSELTRKCREALQANGFNCKEFSIRSSDYSFLQIVDRNHKVPLDIFFGITSGNKISLPMEKVKYRVINEDVVLPLKNEMLAGINFIVPNDIEGFLRERYGDWSTPDRLFRSKENNINAF